MEKKDIIDMKEFLEAIFETSLRLIDVFGDGVQISDVKKLYDLVQNDEQFKRKLLQAYDGYQKIPGQAMDLDAFEIVELTTCMINYIPRILEKVGKTK